MRNATEPNGFEPNRMSFDEYIGKISHAHVLEEFRKWAHYWNGGHKLDFEGWHREFYEWMANGCPEVPKKEKS